MFCFFITSLKCFADTVVLTILRMLTSSLVMTVAAVLLGTLGTLVWAGSDHQHQGYFQYSNVPAHGQYEFGYNRGNPSHYTSRYEQGHNWRFRTKVRWGDKYGGYGEHYWDYNHVDKGGHKGKGHEQTYGPNQHGHVGLPSQGHPSYGHPSYDQGHAAHQGAYSEVNPAEVNPQFHPSQKQQIAV